LWVVKNEPAILLSHIYRDKKSLRLLHGSKKALRYPTTREWSDKGAAEYAVATVETAIPKHSYFCTLEWPRTRRGVWVGYSVS
jgi:hypothetical protein